LGEVLDNMQTAEKIDDIDTIVQSLKSFDKIINKTIEPYQLYCLLKYTQSLSWDMRLFVYDLKKKSGNLYDEHYPIYHAIKQRDKHSARRLAEEHVLENGKLFLKEYLKRCNPDSQKLGD